MKLVMKISPLPQFDIEKLGFEAFSLNFGCMCIIRAWRELLWKVKQKVLEKLERWVKLGDQIC